MGPTVDNLQLDGSIGPVGELGTCHHHDDGHWETWKQMAMGSVHLPAALSCWRDVVGWLHDAHNDCGQWMVGIEVQILVSPYQWGGLENAG